MWMAHSRYALERDSLHRDFVVCAVIIAIVVVEQNITILYKLTTTMF